MTISSEVRAAGPFNGVGTTGPFPFDFKIFQAGDLLVAKVVTATATQVTMVLGTDYTVAQNLDQNLAPGGFVTLLQPLPAGCTLSITSGLRMIQPLSLTNGGGFFPRAVEDAFDRLVMLIQQIAMVGAGQSLRTPEFTGVPPLPAAAARAGMLCGFDDFGNPIAVAPVTGSSADVLLRLAGTGDGQGAKAVGYASPRTGAVAETLHLAMSRQFVTPQTFGGVGDGVTNDTVPMQRFLAAAMAGQPAYLPAGVWSVDEGQLVIEPASNVHTPGPTIMTAGYRASIIKGRGTTQAPMLTIRNLTQSSPAGRFLKGGQIGAIGFDGTAQPGGWNNAHGLSLRGVDGWSFGFINGESLRGDVVNIPRNLYNINNPDPYHVAFCLFHGIQGNFCNGWTLNNDNFVGFTSNEIFNLACYGASTGLGVLRGCGAGNIYKKVSVGTCWGWAIDFYDGAAGGRASREVIDILELDQPQLGVRFINAEDCEIKRGRIVSRFDSGTSSYWPGICVQLSNGASTAAVTRTSMDFLVRVEAGGTRPQLGKFIEANNSTAIDDVRLTFSIRDNAGFGLTNADVIANAFISASATISVRCSIPLEQTLAYDSRAVAGFAASYSAGATILSGGFPSNANILSMGSEVSDKLNQYNPATFKFTPLVSGLYMIDAVIHLTGLVAGNRVKLGLWDGVNVLKAQDGVAVGTGRQGYTLRGVVLLTRDVAYSLIGQTDNGATKTLDAAFGTNTDNCWSVVYLNQ